MLGAYVSRMFQFGYVTNDIERAVEHFSLKMGIEDFFRLETDATVDLWGGQAPFRIKVALANIGDKQVELIEPIDGVNDFYKSGLKLDGVVAALHHFGILVEGPEDNWRAMRETVRACGYDIVLQDRTVIEGEQGMHFAYADTRADYGHYLEFLWRGAEAQRWHDSLPNQYPKD